MDFILLSFHRRFTVSRKEVGQFLLDKDWQVRVITNRYPKNLNYQENIGGLEVKRYLFLSNPMHYLRTGRLDLFFSWLVLKPLNLSWLILEFLDLNQRL